MEYQNNKKFAEQLDDQDPLRKYRKSYFIPEGKNTKNVLYLCGNSLGLQSRQVKKAVNSVLKNWRKKGVEGHFLGKKSWISYNNQLKPSLAKIVGGYPEEIALMNTLTVNLHLMMVSFYRPSSAKFKILIEQDAFPSDKYVVNSQARFHGYDPSDAVIKIRSANGPLLSFDDIKTTIDQHADETALILLSGINYFTGQLLDIKAITSYAHKRNITIGWDLAHAVGNTPLSLHDDNVDFACWCNYKYLNGGPGAIGSVFIHSRHHGKSLPRWDGWWGNDLSTRFQMHDTFSPSSGAEAWVMSTPPTLAIAPLSASLRHFDEAGMESIRKKSIALTGYLQYLIQELKNPKINIITPENPEERGSQLSIQIKDSDKSLYEKIISRDVIVDWREPNVIRVAPVPLYNSFVDVYNFVSILEKCLYEEE